MIESVWRVHVEPVWGAVPNLSGADFGCPFAPDGGVVDVVSAADARQPSATRRFTL